MSSSKPYVAAGKLPEKKNFTQACNLLNQYLNEKGSLRDLNITGKLEPIGRPETSRAPTVDFLSSMENPSPSPATIVRISSPSPPAPEKSSPPPLPQFIDVETYVVGGGKASSSSKPASVEAKTAAMTIFYGDHVMVFNDFSEEKAREIMRLATTGGDIINRGKAPLTSPENSVPITGSNTATIVEANGSDLPIARRASLHKFLAKRKDRATARAAPYQVTTSSHRDELDFDLNL